MGIHHGGGSGLTSSLLPCPRGSQENSSSGSKVLQLILSDPDSPENGPPYSFRITKGDNASVFRVTPDGWLVTAASLSRSVQDQYQLEIEVRAAEGHGGCRSHRICPSTMDISGRSHGNPWMCWPGPHTHPCPLLLVEVEEAKDMPGCGQTPLPCLMLILTLVLGTLVWVPP